MMYKSQFWKNWPLWLVLWSRVTYKHYLYRAASSWLTLLLIRTDLSWILSWIWVSKIDLAISVKPLWHNLYCIKPYRRCLYWKTWKQSFFGCSDLLWRPVASSSSSMYVSTRVTCTRYGSEDRSTFSSKPSPDVGLEGSATPL